MSVFNVFGSVPQGLDERLRNALSEIILGLKVQLELYFDFVSPSSGEETIKVLVLLEPPSVMPENYTLKALKRFDLVIPLSPWRAEIMASPFSAFQPVQVPKRVLSRDVKESKLVFVNALKFGSVNSSLYGWRLEILRKLQQSGIHVDVYGPNWDMSIQMEIRKRIAATRRALTNRDFDLFEAWKEFSFRPVEIQGETRDKLDTISKYRFALVIENDLFSLTEKLFDALISGAIVFYRGPKLQTHTNLGNYCYELPENVNLAVKMIESIIKLPESQTIHINAHQLELKEFAEPFLLENTSKMLGEAIIAFLGSQSRRLV